MTRNFKPNEFAFDAKDLSTPDNLMACLKRMDHDSINVPGYATQLYQAVTNQNSFDSDEWFDVGFEIGARSQLQEFANTPWVKQDLTAAGLVPGQPMVKRPLDQIAIEVLHVSPSM